MSSTVELWQVYYVFCKYTKPTPKNKFIVIMCFDETIPMGILINSEINNFIKKRNHLMSCEVTLEQERHNFLRHTSYLDCRDIFSFPEVELTDLRGVMHPDIRQDVINAVKACPVLVLKHKIQILSQWGK